MPQKLNGGWERRLFYGGSVFFIFLFLAMTFDTVLIVTRRGQIGVKGLTPELVTTIAQGKLLWEKNDCVGCHSLLGEGAYFASELSNVYQRYDSNVEAIKKIIQYPSSAGVQWRRSMPQFNFTALELDALVEFLKYSSKIRPAHWPPHQEG